MKIKRAAAAAVGIAALLFAGGLYLRLDKTQVFHRVRGDYRGVGVLETWRTGGSEVRLVELRNHRGETPLTALVRSFVQQLKEPDRDRARAEAAEIRERARIYRAILDGWQHGRAESASAR